MRPPRFGVAAPYAGARLKFRGSGVFAFFANLYYLMHRWLRREERREQFGRLGEIAFTYYA
jgi:hypothetical protein